MLNRLFAFLFPPKCTLCRKILSKAETDLCHNCRANAPEFEKSKFHIPFVAGWTALWYYKGDVRSSLLRFKFYNARSYGAVYGKLLAMWLLQTHPEGFDLLTWVPIAPLRRLKRGYDQVELIAQSVGRELDISPRKTLRKIRNTPPQSGLENAAARRANVLGAYRVVSAEDLAGKRIVLLDDIITTGATASECARTLLTAGAKEIFCVAVAAAPQDTKMKK